MVAINKVCPCVLGSLKHWPSPLDIPGFIALPSSATAAPPLLGDPVVDDSDIRLSWDHTDKAPCYSHLTFSYNITWYPVNVQRETATTDVAATEYVITVNSKY